MSLFTKRGTNKLDFVFSYLLFYIFFYWVFQKTVFGNNAFVYISFVFLFFVLGVRALSKVDKVDNMALMWVPYFLYTAFGYFLQSNIESFSYWMIGLFVMLSASNQRVINMFDRRLVLYIGIFIAIGVLYNYLFTESYNSTIAPLYFQDVKAWSSIEYGYAGFTYQLGVTACILNTAEMLIIYLYLKDRTISKKWILWGCLVIIIICIFLTGKRTNSIIAIVVPALVSYLTKSKTSSRHVSLLLLLSGSIVALYLAYIHLDAMINSDIFHRVATAYTDYQTGEDITSNRLFLWEKALSIYHDAPLLGVGVGRYEEIAKVGTGAHSIYIQCLCEQGIVGLLFFIFPLIYCIITTVKLTHYSNSERLTNFACFSLAIQLRYMLDGITENDNSNLIGFLFYAVSISLAIDCRTRLKSSKNIIISSYCA